MSQPKPGLLRFVFDYPYHIGVPAGSYLVRLKADAIGVIKISGREGIQSYDKSLNQRPRLEDNEEPELIAVEGDQRSGRVIMTTNNGAAIYTIAGEKGKSIYPWYFSSVEIIFAVNDVYASIETESNAIEARRLMQGFFNKFLHCYRHSSADTFTRILSEESDLSLYVLLYINEFSDEEIKGGFLGDVLTNFEKLDSRKFKPYPVQGVRGKEDIVPIIEGRHTSPFTSTDIKKSIIDGGKLNNIKNNCYALDEMPSYRKMFLSGLEKIALDSDYKSAIINFDTAVEMAVASIITEALRRKGKTEQEIEDLFDESVSASYQLQDKGYLTTMRRMKRLEEAINEVRDQNGMANLVLKNTIEYKDWDEKVRKKRNKIVHAGRTYNEAEAKDAFIAGQKFILFLENEERDMIIGHQA